MHEQRGRIWTGDSMHEHLHDPLVYSERMRELSDSLIAAGHL